MTDRPITITDLEDAIRKLRDAPLGPAKLAAGDRALEVAGALFRAYDARIGALNVTIDNLADRVGRLEAARSGGPAARAAMPELLAGSGVRDYGG